MVLEVYKTKILSLNLMYICSYYFWLFRKTRKRIFFERSLFFRLEFSFVTKAENKKSARNTISSSFIKVNNQIIYNFSYISIKQQQNREESFTDRQTEKIIIV